MKSRILAFAGSKQAGKSTCSNFIHGYQLRAQRVIDNFAISEDGKLVVQTQVTNADGEIEESGAYLDISREDPEFAEWAAYNMWPYVKSYSFAAPLKEIAVTLFGLKPEQVYGTDLQKNSKTWFRWEEMPGVITEKTATQNPAIKAAIKEGRLQYHEPGRMTSREFLQFFGTDVCRRIFSDIWQERLVSTVAEEGSLVAVIDDCRFPNEAEAIQNAGGKVIRLTRSPHKDSHSSEGALSSYKNFDAVIDNQNMTVDQVNVEIIKLMTEWGWISTEITPERTESPPEPHLEDKYAGAELVGGIHTIKESQ